MAAPAGHGKGWFLEPAVIAEPGDDSRLMTEEVFGPVLPVSRFTDFDDAIAPRQRHPVRARLLDLDHDARLIHRAAQEIESGMTWVNQIHYGYDELPFGGVKASGYGKEHGLEALDSYVEIKSVVVGRSRVNGVSPSTDGGVGFDHARQPAGQLVRPRVHERVLERGRRGRSPAPPARSSSRSASPKFFSAGADVKKFLEATSTPTWR